MPLKGRCGCCVENGTERAEVEVRLSWKVTSGDERDQQWLGLEW